MRLSASSSYRCLAALVLPLLAAAGAHSATCNVPTATHPTLAAAARDAGCTLVQLAAGSFPENVTLERDLAIAGAGSAATTLQGYFFVAGAGHDVTLDGLLVDGTAAGVAGCWTEILAAEGGATLTSGADVKVLQTATGGTACRLFADGFESGGVLTWSVRSLL